MFTTAPGQWEPPLRDYLGDLTDEAPKNAITAFVTRGPKNKPSLWHFHLTHVTMPVKLFYSNRRGPKSGNPNSGVYRGHITLGVGIFVLWPGSQIEILKNCDL